MFLRLVELLTGMLVIFFFVTQVTIPLGTGRLLFPAFRPKRRALEEQLAAQREQEELDALKSKLHSNKES